MFKWYFHQNISTPKVYSPEKFIRNLLIFLQKKSDRCLSCLWNFETWECKRILLSQNLQKKICAKLFSHLSLTERATYLRWTLRLLKVQLRVSQIFDFYLRIQNAKRNWGKRRGHLQQNSLANIFYSLPKNILTTQVNGFFAN